MTHQSDGHADHDSQHELNQEASRRHLSWDGEDLVLDNTNTLLQEYRVDYLFFGLETQLALAIKWIMANKMGNEWQRALGPNLLINMPQGTPLHTLSEEVWGRQRSRISKHGFQKVLPTCAIGGLPGPIKHLPRGWPKWHRSTPSALRMPVLCVHRAYNKLLCVVPY